MLEFAEDRAKSRIGNYRGEARGRGDRPSPRGGDGDNGSGGGGGGGMNSGNNNYGGFQGSDWICECGCQNFAKRSECFKCNRSKATSCVSYIDTNSHSSSNVSKVFLSI
jgi:hypothetical protein